MKLYELRSGDRFRIAPEERGEDCEAWVYTFDHVDGAYSVCFAPTEARDVVHFAAWTPVEKVEEAVS